MPHTFFLWYLRPGEKGHIYEASWWVEVRRNPFEGAHYCRTSIHDIRNDFRWKRWAYKYVTSLSLSFLSTSCLSRFGRVFGAYFYANWSRSASPFGHTRMWASPVALSVVTVYNINRITSLCLGNKIQSKRGQTYGYSGGNSWQWAVYLGRQHWQPRHHERLQHVWLVTSWRKSTQN